MDQTRAPLLEALAEYHELDRYGFTPPGHRQGRGADPRVLEVIGSEPFRSDVLASAGLDDRSSSGGYLKQAEQLMADAVGAEHAFFSTCGSSLSVKSAMLAVAGHEGDLLLSRDAHKSVVAGLIFSGLRPCWVTPRWDANLHMAHPPSPEEIAEAWGAHLPFHPELPTWAMDAGADVCVVSVHKMGAGFEQGSVFHVRGDLVDPSHIAACADLLMTTSPNALLYTALDGWRRQMVEHGESLLGAALELARRLRRDIEAMPGLHVLERELVAREASHELDQLQVLIDVTGLGISGYQAADWLREHERIDIGLSDHGRILATLSMADDETTARRLRAALEALIAAARNLPRPNPIKLPKPSELQLDSVERPRDAFFGPVESVPVADAVGRIAAEQITPYPPGIPVVVPGERLNREVIDLPLTGLEGGMVLPDPADPKLETIRVTAAARRQTLLGFEPN
jgi:arginine decarboxylase